MPLAEVNSNARSYTPTGDFVIGDTAKVLGLQGILLNLLFVLHLCVASDRF
ncbi:hypothetical protein [Nostoc sp.]